jgi:hypothetical protein
VTALEQLKIARQTRFAHEDGKEFLLELLPPATEKQITSTEERAGAPLPEELCEVLSLCSGIERTFADIDFTGGLLFGHEEVFPHGLPIAGDGFGNFWVLDVSPKSAKSAPIYFACHDAPIILFQCADLATFISELLRMHTPPFKSLIDDAHEDRLFKVWKTNPGVINHATALKSTDPTLAHFASTLSPNFQIIDLRNAPPGMGFSWGRYGPRTEIRRDAIKPIFAYAAPPKKSILSKLFGQ